jgi:hypothetical protein
VDGNVDPWIYSFFRQPVGVSTPEIISDHCRPVIPSSHVGAAVGKALFTLSQKAFEAMVPKLGITDNVNEFLRPASFHRDCDAAVPRPILLEVIDFREFFFFLFIWRKRN